MAFQQLVVNAVDVVDGMDALSIREILVLLAVALIVMHDVEHFVKVLFCVTNPVYQFIIETQNLCSQLYIFSVIIGNNMFVQLLLHFLQPLLHGIKTLRHIRV